MGRWIKESPEEVDKLMEEYRKSEDYYDDGNTPVTCVYCGTKTVILSAPCCEKRREEKEKDSRQIFEMMKDVLGTFKDE
jgi:hypothetical protein